MERLYEDLNDEQKKVVRAPAQLFVPACPGAGKTRTLVARTLRILNERTDPGRGVALLSFTNNATREARRRAAQVAMRGHVRFPSFIGTFDAFLNRFFVVPFGSPWAPRRRPEIRDTWASFGIQPIRLKGLSCPEGIGIDELIVEKDGAVCHDRQGKNLG